MDIGLIDVDGHNFPNIPLMKISAFHKAQGNNVEFVVPIECKARDGECSSECKCFSLCFKLKPIHWLAKDIEEIEKRLSDGETT